MGKNIFVAWILHHRINSIYLNYFIKNGTNAYFLPLIWYDMCAMRGSEGYIELSTHAHSLITGWRVWIILRVPFIYWNEIQLSNLSEFDFQLIRIWSVLHSSGGKYWITNEIVHNCYGYIWMQRILIA